MKPETARAGTLLCVDRGEYSDYQVIGFLVILRDFDPHAELEEYLAKKPDQRKEYEFLDYGYLAALTEKGLMLEIEYGTLFLGGYGCSDDVRFTPVSGGNNDET